MAIINARLHLLTIILFSLDTIIAPSPDAFLLAHDSSIGITDTRDIGAVKSTIELSGERTPRSQPCRRGLLGCFPGIGRAERATWTEDVADDGDIIRRYRDTRPLTPPMTRKTEMILKLHQFEGKVLFGFFPKLRDRWNLAHAGYKEVLAEAFRSTGDWGDGGTLASTLADLRTARQRTTTTLGLSPEVRQYISKRRILELYGSLTKSLDRVMKHLITSA